MLYFVYVLYSHKLQKRYIGLTNNVSGRLIQHNNGKAPFTKRGVPWSLIYYEAFITKADAIVEERFLKTGQGRERMSRALRDTMSVIHG